MYEKIPFIIAGFIALIALAFVANRGLIKLDQTTAIIQVREVPEVVVYEAMLREADKEASFEAEDRREVWLIQVFEIVKNDEGPSHTATFGWYFVNKITGEITKEYPNP